ncbi:MAG: hypothetical protein AAF677_04170 [Pseudomonadota bacterium]
MDKRITERLARNYGKTLQTITTSERESLSAMVARAQTQMALFAPVPTLRIFAHGLYDRTSGPSGVRTRTTGGEAGGFGVQLSAEGLHASTVATLAPLAGLIAARGMVLVYACGAANDAYPRDPHNVRNNGSLLMAMLARTMGVPVYASDAMQEFRHITYTPPVFGTATTFADFGGWEGDVYRFEPSGKRTTVTATAPLK